MTRDAELLDACSALLEAHGARPVPTADPGWRFTDPVRAARRCRSCRHPVVEHGASGECWVLNPECTCGRADE